MEIKEKIPLEEKTISSTKVYEGRVVTVYKDEVEFANGDRLSRDVVVHKDLAVILALLDGEVVLERHFRYPDRNLIIEAPAGKAESGEKMDQVAIRELEEETGLHAEKVKFLGKLVSNPPYIKEDMYFYLADNLKQGKMNRDKDEFMDIFTVPLDELFKMIKEDEINDMKTVALAMLYQLKK